ncbi:MAG: class I SAM-dependent methyltransferase [Terracidiphilus sp.]
MRTFVRHYIAPLARKRLWKSICEVGSRTGASADHLLNLPLFSYTIIDPCIDQDLGAKYAGDSRVQVIKSNSLDALTSNQRIGPAAGFDCILIDGDHNWYTVFNELRLIRGRALVRPGGFIFLHDVDWPYGRRDLYYQPDAIPVEFRHPFAQKGMIRGQSALTEVGGLNSTYFNALEEGGPKNGVLAAVEDFLAQHPRDYRFFRIHYQYGLGVLQFGPGGAFAAAPYRELKVKAYFLSPVSRLSRSLKFAFRHEPDA